MMKRAYYKLTHAPSLEAQFCLTHRIGFVRGFIAGVILMAAAGITLRILFPLP